MIRINLAPDEELSSPYPWLPDLVVLIFTVSIGLGMVHFFLNDMEEQINGFTAETQRYQEGARLLADDLRKYRELNTRLDDLKNRVASLQKITESKLTRYRPVLLMEHLQTLKPEGIWFQEVRMLEEAQPNQAGAAGATRLPTPGADGANSLRANELMVVGYTLDNVLLAEFLSALKSTEMQDVDSGDLRTQIYFGVVSLKRSISEQNGLAQNNTGPSPLRFELRLEYRERTMEQRSATISEVVWPGGKRVLNF